jgi:hypothetical protein
MGAVAASVGNHGSQMGSRRHERVSDYVANPSFYLVAGARNHLPANTPLEFSFEIAI